MVSVADKYNEQLIQANKVLAQENADLKTKIAWFEEQFRLAQHRQFGSSSEQTPSGQESLFNEAEVVADTTPPEVEIEQISYGRRKFKGQRDIKLKDLPVEQIEYVLPDEEQVCPQCTGKLHDMGVEMRCEVKHIPAQLVLVHHNQHKYACRHCQTEETTTPIVIASMPRPAFPNSLASPSIVAHIMTQKFVMGLPLYRQEQQFERQDFNLSRQTMANWMIKGADWLTVVYERMHQVLLGKDILHADETTLQVLKEDGRTAQTDSYMWLYRTGRDGPPIVLFEYQTGRSGDYPKAFLQGFNGKLHADCYAGYDRLPPDKVTIIGCLGAHARRKFDEAVKALPASARKKPNGLPQIGLAFFAELYKIEHDLKDATAEERFKGRLERSKPVLERFKVWLDEMAPKVLPKGALGMAIAYCRNNWTKLTNFLLDGRLEIDNNRAERAIRPFVIGRRNWLFANTPRGANASAVIYSIVETAKENGLDPFKYLTHLFETLPNIDTNDLHAIDKILPWSSDLPDNCRVKRTAKPQS